MRRSPTYIGSAENGARNLTIQVLTMFARAFGLTVSELLAGLEERAEKLSKGQRRTHAPSASKILVVDLRR